MKRNLRRWGVVYLLPALFLASLAGQWFTQLAEYTSEQTDHGQPFERLGFLAAFLAEMFANWQSEFLQLLIQAVFVVALAHRMFAKSTEDIDALHRKVDHLTARLEHRD